MLSSIVALDIPSRRRPGWQARAQSGFPTTLDLTSNRW
jgi:hypothetical protein